MTQPLFRASSTVSAFAVAGCTGAEPTGTVSGDIVLASLHLEPVGTTGAITPPAGWTQIGTEAVLADSRVRMYWIRRGGSAPSYAWTWATAGTYSEINIQSASLGIPAGNAIDSFTIGTPAASGTIVTPPPVSILSADTLVTIWAFNWINGWTTVPTAPSGYTTRIGNGAGFDGIAASKGTSAIGTETPGAFSAAAGSSPNVGITVVIASQAAGATQGAAVPAMPRVTYVFNRKVPPFWPPARELGLSTQNQAAAPQTLTLAAAQGSFAFTGQIAGLAKAIAVGLSPPSPPLFGEINRKVPPFWPPARELGLSTQNGSSVQALVLTAAQGTFALTGQAINLPRGRTVAAAQGSFAFTGQAAGFPKGHTVMAAQGSFAFTGQAAGFPKGHTVTAAQGSFAFTGQAVNLVKGHTISAAQGSFAFTGQAVNLPRGRTLAATQGAFALTGQAAGFPVGRTLSAAQGAFAFTGEPVNLVKVSLTIGAARAQPLVPGHFNRRQPPFWPPAREASLSTQNQIPVRTLLAGVGSFGFTGVAIGMPRARTLPMAQGSFALTGQAVNLPLGRTLPAVQGSFALTGQTAGLPRGRTLTMAQGAFAFTGQPAGLPRARRLVAGQGAFAMTGLAAALTWVSGHAKVLAASTGFFGFTGRAVGLVLAQSGQGGTASARMHTQRASASLSRMVFVGTKFRASCVFLDFDKNPADTTVTFTVAGVAQTVVRDSVGNYHSDFTPAEAGRFHWQWAGTGTVSAVTEGFIEVLPTEE